MRSTPSYIALFRNGNLDHIIDVLENKFRTCNICPHNCKVDRINTSNSGFCKTGSLPVISSYGAHFGEEAPLKGHFGSGTIFLTNCNMRCVYCQNYDISQLGTGNTITIDDLAAIMIKLQKDGCHNINFVSPTHQILAIVNALKIAAENGLNIPLVYNSGGYDSVETLKLLDGIFDIYMPDFKYLNNRKAKKYSGVNNYVDHAIETVLEMYKQVGDLKTNNGIAYRGLLIRHLVLPKNISDSEKFMDFAEKSFDGGIHINIMDQYRPCFRAWEFNKLHLEINPAKFQKIINRAVIADFISLV